MKNRVIALLIGVIGMATLMPVARGQRAQDASSPPSPSFDVASVKENKALAFDEGSIFRMSTPGRVTITNMPVAYLLQIVYDVRADQVIGTPAWTRAMRIDINATYAGGPATEAQVHVMLQRLFADRFSIVTHRETRDVPTYALLLARSDGRLGPGLVRTEPIDCVKYRADGRPQIGAGGPSPVAPGGQRPQCMLINNGRFMSGGTQTMAEIIASLRGNLGRPIADETGLTGAFNIDFSWTPASQLGVSADSNPDGVPLPTALQDQLGLKLEPRRGSVEMLVIDSMKPPTPD